MLHRYTDDLDINLDDYTHTQPLTEYGDDTEYSCSEEFLTIAPSNSIIAKQYKTIPYIKLT